MQSFHMAPEKEGKRMKDGGKARSSQKKKGAGYGGWAESELLLYWGADCQTLHMHYNIQMLEPSSIHPHHAQNYCN